jgi:hypothetical protein
MADPQAHLDELIARYLERTASEAELTELERRLAADPRALEAFVAAGRLDAWLRTLVQEEAQRLQTLSRLQTIEAENGNAPPRWFSWQTLTVAAAVLVLGAVGLWWAVRGWSPAPVPRGDPEPRAIARSEPTRPLPTMVQRADVPPGEMPVAGAVAMFGIVTASMVK